MQEPMTLYPNASTPTLDPELFRNPTSEYRCTPFWAWNNRLEAAELCRQLDVFRSMGMGGAHMHSRTGLATPYMGEEFLAAVRACVEKCRADNMLAWLYDEDRWPSGAAGGLVTQDPRWRLRALHFVSTQYEPDSDLDRRLLARYNLRFSPDGTRLLEYRRLGEGDTASEHTWYAYCQTAPPSTWYNGQTYLDTLNPEAVRRFIEVTHERYAEHFQKDFGTVVPAIFTDEPQYQRLRMPAETGNTDTIRLPWTLDLPETFATRYSFSLIERLPEVIWEPPDNQPNRVRYCFFDHVSERFAHAFVDTIGDWCENHGIALTGHLMAEESLRAQIGAVGDAMRCYRSFQLPGIDMLCDLHEYSTAKQAQSATHQYGRPGVLSELYGVTNWDFDFVGHKAQGDWQAALGVTVRVPHLSWVSMGGEAKRDYPASIGYQSPWWPEYRTVEDHFARINAVLTRGRPHVRIAVVHPVESGWLAYGADYQTSKRADALEKRFQDCIRWLLEAGLDFDFLCEAELPNLARGCEDGALRVGEMAYDAVLVPHLETIRATTLQRCAEFATAGGRLVFAGPPPSLVDAVPSDRAAQLAGHATTVAWDRQAVREALEPCRDVEVRCGTARATSMLYQLRSDGERRYLFLCNTNRTQACDTTVRVRGHWQAMLLDTATGEMRTLPAAREGAWTLVPWYFEAHGHLLVELTPAPQPSAEPASAPSALPRWEPVSHLDGPVQVTLSEPNCLLLDAAEWRINQGDWHPRQELLRVDRELRNQLGMPLRTGQIAQPWTQHERARVMATVCLRFAIRSEVAVDAPCLAAEDVDRMRVRLDGAPVATEVTGWYVDKAIHTIALPPLAAGTHELELEFPFSDDLSIEWCYLLGDFGVVVEGPCAGIVEPIRQLSLGDWCRQGLPFYAGNVTYHFGLEAPGGPLGVRFPGFRAPVLRASLDHKRSAPVAFAPFRFDAGTVAPGSHCLDVTVYGNRVNAFGQVHNPDLDFGWWGPNSWRTHGDKWSDAYVLRPMGLLEPPVVERAR